MPATFDKILGKPLLHTHQAADIAGLSSSDTSLTITTNQTLTSSSANIILADCTTNSLTIILPAASTVTNKTFKIKKIDSTLNTLTIDANGSETIDGDQSTIISFQNTTVDLVSNGNNWYII